MTTEDASLRPNGILEDVEAVELPKREIKNHILFEISTEAANRGTPLTLSFPMSLVVLLTPVQSEVYTR